MEKANVLGIVFALALSSSIALGENNEADKKPITLRNGRVAARFELRNGSLIGEELINRSSGFNWLVPGKAIGPWLVYGQSNCWPDQVYSISSSRSRGQNGEPFHAVDWANTEGTTMRWMVRLVPKGNVFEFQAQLRNNGSKPIEALREFGPLALPLRAGPGKLKIHWVRRDTYKHHEVFLTDSFAVRGGSWNAPESAGWVAIENSDQKEILFLGGEWESYWRIALHERGTAVDVVYTVERFTRDLLPGQTLDAPRIFLGLTHGDLDDSIRDLHDYLRQNLIPSTPEGFPWVSYNIWGTAGDGSDETAILKEIPLAANLGIDLFYVDASWYEGSCTNRSGDWFPGLGNWHRENFQKYPRGLAYIAKKVHQAGMKFGLWFAPQMVDSRLVKNRIPEAWVARRDGTNLVTGLGGPSPITQICLGDARVQQFLKQSISSAIERYNLDWVKWDGSGLPGLVCNSTEHGHGKGDGALAAIQGEYDVYSYLHRKFPRLVLEQCGYGSRLDYGLARYMRANWLDDSSGDAIPVRRRVLNGSYIYPAAYLETWVYKGPETDKQKDPDILNATIRSRMMGAFGFGCLINSPQGVERLSLYPPEAIAVVRRNIADYKKYRHLLLEDVYHFPPASGESNAGDAIEFCKRDGSDAAVMLFQNGNAYDSPNPTPFDDRLLPDIVHGKNITAQSGDSQWGFVAQGACSGAGLDFETGTRHGTGLTDMWLGSASGGQANPHAGTAKGANWISFTFDKTYSLGKTWVWNWNNEGAGNTTGLNHVTIEYSETGGSTPEEWKKLGDFQFFKATGKSKYPGFAGPDFAGALVKYVVITVHPLTPDAATSGSWGAGDCGLSEIRFFLNTEKANAAIARMQAALERIASPELKRSLQLRGLQANKNYNILSLNFHTARQASGSELMSKGIHVVFDKEGMSEILLLKRQ